MAPKKKGAAKGDKKEDNEGGAEEKQPKGPTERELQMKGEYVTENVFSSSC